MRGDGQPSFARNAPPIGLQGTGSPADGGRPLSNGRRLPDYAMAYGGRELSKDYEEEKVGPLGADWMKRRPSREENKSYTVGSATQKYEKAKSSIIDSL